MIEQRKGRLASTRASTPRSYAFFGVVVLGGLACVDQAGPPNAVEGTHSDVIYGTDNRTEIKDVVDPELKGFGAAVAAIGVQIDSCPGGFCTFTGLESFTGAPVSDTLSLPLCSTERFRGQLRGGGNCTGFLVAPDTFVTAGHCLCETPPCSCNDSTGKPLSVVFDFQAGANGQPPSGVASSEVYKCTGVPQGILASTGEDWAVFKVDRPVAHRTPLIVQYSGSLAHDTAAIYGFPFALPLKMTDGAAVEEDTDAFKFFTNADVYKGDSGGPTVDTSTKIVTGVTVTERDSDFAAQSDGNGGSCAASHVCPTNGGAPCNSGPELTGHSRMPHIAQTAKIPLHVALISAGAGTF
ncbi:MAG TPA: trypsin-like peptidase domain-containing protein [Polyangia bacterium]|jgi:V8-like Glu-specific endopeptidase|nr:trypsin-like peptidase domain-containing protein [Polyangia bacterium]